MQPYDVALKLLLQASNDLMRQLTGVSMARWLNVKRRKRSAAGSTC